MFERFWGWLNADLYSDSETYIRKMDTRRKIIEHELNIERNVLLKLKYNYRIAKKKKQRKAWKELIKQTQRNIKRLKAQRG